MIEMLRGSVSGWVAKIFIGLLVLSFGVWGVADVFRTDARGAAVSVGETTVSAIEYNQVYRRTLNSMSRQFGTQLTPEQGRALGIEPRVMGEVVSGAVLDEYARLLNLGLSDDTLARLIGADPAFQDFNGNFDRGRFQQAIRNAQMREDDYINNRNKIAVRNQIFEATARGKILPKTFYTAAATYTNEERKFDYLVLTAKNLAIDPVPTASDVEKYFKDNKANYAAPEYRKIEFISVQPEDLVDQITIEADEIRQDYDSRKDKYGTAERRRVQQIVFSDEDEAAEALEALQDGTIFETLVADLDLKIEDLDLGLISQSEMPDKKVAEAVFALELNATSGVIEGVFGQVIVRATEIVPEVITPFDEVKESIRNQLALQRAGDEVINIQDAVEDLRAGGATLREIARKQNLKLQTVAAVDVAGIGSDGQPVTILPNSIELLRGAFAADVGEETDYLNFGTAGYAWYDVAAITPARDRTLDEVKSEVTADWRRAEIASEIGARASKLKERLDGNDTLTKVAGEIGLEVRSTDFLKRSGSSQALNVNAVRIGFTTKQGQAAIAPGAEEGAQVLLQVASIQQSTTRTLPDDEKTGIERTAGNDVLEQLVDQLRTRFGVKVNRTLVQLAQSQDSGRF